jgi:high-affinity iron transporter
MTNVFSVQIFFISFRETLEASIIVSVLLAFIKQGIGRSDDKKLYKKLVWQVWMGALAGLLVCLAIGGGFIGAFYGLGKDIWSQSEDLWEGIFSLIAAIMITFVGLALLRVNKMKEKWRLKIARAIIESADTTNKAKGVYASIKRWSTKYAMFVLPFITVMREGVELVVFVGGVSLGTPATAFPLAVICGAACGIGVGFIIYKGGNMMALQYFLIASTCFLYLIAAGLFSRAIWSLQYHVFAVKTGGDVAEQGDGPGSYDISENVWHVNCCNPGTSGGYEIFNALLGWQNSATYGSVISYNVYWLFIMAVVVALIYEEKKGGLPLIDLLPWRKKKQISAEERANVIRQAEEATKTKYQSKVTTQESDSSIRDTDQETKALYESETNKVPQNGESILLRNETELNSGN